MYASPRLLGQSGAADEAQMPPSGYLGDYQLCLGVKADLKYLNLSTTDLIQCFGSFMPIVHSSRKAICKYILLFTLTIYGYQPCSHWPAALVCHTADVEKHQFNSGSRVTLEIDFRPFHHFQHTSPWKPYTYVSLCGGFCLTDMFYLLPLLLDRVGVLSKPSHFWRGEGDRLSCSERCA